MPLLNDVHGGAVALAKLNFRRDQSTIRATKYEEFPYSAGTGGRTKGTVRWETRAWVTVRIRNPNVDTLNRLGALNPLSVVWELVPFSFVADWFINIGDCISELSWLAGVQVLDGGSSTLVEFVGRVTETNPSPWDKPNISNFQSRKYSRTPGVQTMPRLQIRSNPLNLSKLTSATALIKQAVLGADWAGRSDSHIRSGMRP